MNLHGIPLTLTPFQISYYDGDGNYATHFVLGENAEQVRQRIHHALEPIIQNGSMDELSVQQIRPEWFLPLDSYIDNMRADYDWLWEQNQ